MNALYEWRSAMAVTLPPAAKIEQRQRRKSARREEILDAALHVFAQKGFEGTTVVDVARQARVASGTVYLYFASKLDLFVALNARLLEVIVGAMWPADAPPDVRDGASARIHAVFRASSQHRDLLRLVFLNSDPRTEVARRMRRADEERLRPLAELLGSGMEAGVVRRADPALLAELINGVTITALYQCFVQSDGRDAHVYEELVTEMIVGCLTP